MLPVPPVPTPFSAEAPRPVAVAYSVGPETPLPTSGLARRSAVIVPSVISLPSIEFPSWLKALESMPSSLSAFRLATLTLEATTSGAVKMLAVETNCWARTSPSTSSLAPGVVVPMPTLPAGVTFQFTLSG